MKKVLIATALALGAVTANADVIWSIGVNVPPVGVYVQGGNVYYPGVYRYSYPYGYGFTYVNPPVYRYRYAPPVRYYAPPPRPAYRPPQVRHHLPPRGNPAYNPVYRR